MFFDRSALFAVLSLLLAVQGYGSQPVGKLDCNKNAAADPLSTSTEVVNNADTKSGAENRDINSAAAGAAPSRQLPAERLYIVSHGFRADEKRAEENKRLNEELFKAVLQSCPRKINEIIELYKKGKHFESRSNILLYGPSGTGKTTIAYAFANECKLEPLFVSAPFISNKYKNGGEDNLKIILDELMANKNRVLIIDEFEAILNKHDQTNTGDQNLLRAFWSLLDECKKHKIFVICTMNFTSELPDQIKTRFSAIYKVDMPDEVQRKAIIKFHLERLYSVHGIDYSETVEDQLSETARWYSFSNKKFLSMLASKTKKFAPRMLAHLVDEAGIAAYLRQEKKPVIQLQDLFAAIPRVEKEHENVVLPKTWGQWWGDNKNLVIGTGVTLAVAGVSTYFAYKGLKTQEASHTLAKASHKLAEASHGLAQSSAASNEQMNKFSRIMAYWNYYFNWRQGLYTSLKPEDLQGILKFQGTDTSEFFRPIKSDK